MFYRKGKIPPLFLHATPRPSAGLRLGTERGYQLSVSSTAACDSLQVGRPRVLKRRLRLKLVFRVWNWSKFGVLETKRRTSPNRAFALQLRTATTASHPVVITARKIEARSWWDSWGCRIRQAAVLGRQNRLTRCFRELAKWIHTSFRSREPINSAMATYRWNMAFTKHFVVFRRIV